MKRIANYLIFLAFFLMPIYSMAQITYGPKIGLNLSKMSGQFSTEDSSDFKNIARFQIGVVTKFQLSEIFSFQPELLFSQKGFSQKASYNNEDFNVSGETKITLNYLELPLLLNLEFKKSNFEFYGNVGPYVAYALGGKYKITMKYDYPALMMSDDISQSGKIKFKSESENWTGDDIILGSDEYSRFDCGGYIGAGIGKEIGPGKFVLDFRYGHGFVDFFKNADFIDILYSEKGDGYKKFQNRTFTITLTYLFSGKKTE